MHSGRLVQKCIQLQLSLSLVQSTERDGCSCAEAQHMLVLLPGKTIDGRITIQLAARGFHISMAREHCCAPGGDPGPPACPETALGSGSSSLPGRRPRRLEPPASGDSATGGRCAPEASAASPPAAGGRLGCAPWAPSRSAAEADAQAAFSTLLPFWGSRPAAASATLGLSVTLQSRDEQLVTPST